MVDTKKEIAKVIAREVWTTTPWNFDEIAEKVLGRLRELDIEEQERYHEMSLEEHYRSQESDTSNTGS